MMAPMRLFRRPMVENEFWSLIAVMGGETGQEAVARLSVTLETRPRRAVIGFQERLARVLFELDREELAQQRVRFIDDPPGAETIPLSDDSFLYLRAGIVAKGRNVWEAVLAKPSMLAQDAWDMCEDLLYVAENVIGDEVDTKVSYETGSNERYWPVRPEPAREPWDQGPRLVYVECRDLSEPIHGEEIHFDGTAVPVVEYPTPTYIPHSLVEHLVTRFSKLIALNGGLPVEIGADQLQVIINFGPGWQIEPVVGAPVDDDVFGTVRPIEVSVNADEAGQWSARAKRAQLLALTASCLLAVLPPRHPARPEITDIATGPAKRERE